MAETWYRVYPNDPDAEKEIDPVTVYKETPAYVYLNENLRTRDAKVSSNYCYYKTKELALKAVAERVGAHRTANLKNLREFENEVREQIRNMFVLEHEYNKRLAGLRRELAKT